MPYFMFDFGYMIRTYLSIPKLVLLTKNQNGPLRPYQSFSHSLSFSLFNSHSYDHNLLCSTLVNLYLISFQYVFEFFLHLLHRNQFLRGRYHFKWQRSQLGILFLSHTHTHTKLNLTF